MLQVIGDLPFVARGSPGGDGVVDLRFGGAPALQLLQVRAIREIGPINARAERRPFVSVAGEYGDPTVVARGAVDAMGDELGGAVARTGRHHAVDQGVDQLGVEEMHRPFVLGV